MAAAGKQWQISGNGAKIEIKDQSATIKLPSAVSVANFEGDLSSQLSPPGSGGMLVTLHLWQRLIEKGLRRYGEVYYLGQLPEREQGQRVDCLVGIYAGIETCFQFDPQSGNLVGIIMQPNESVDPCELRLADYTEIDGRQLPMSWRVYHGDELFLQMNVESWEFTPEAGGQN